jgi:VanZ family protein
LTSAARAGRGLRALLEGYERFYPALRALTVALGALIVVLSLIDDPSRATGGNDLGAILSRLLFGTGAYGDKVSHFAAYGALGFLALLGFGRHRMQAVLVAVVLLALGGALELLQAAGGVRTGDLMDMAANAGGVAAGTGAGTALRLLWRQAFGRLA